MSVWTDPKTDWAHEAFMHTDYNRIKGNLLYLHERANGLFPPATAAPDFGSDKAFGSYFYASEFNAFENELESLNRRSISADIGQKQTFYALGDFIRNTELNRIESASLALYNAYAPMVAIPYITGTYAYDGTLQEPTLNYYDSSLVTLAGGTSGTDAGTYTITASLKYPDENTWSDGTTASKTLTWRIEKAVLRIPATSGSYTYDGTLKTLAFTGFDGNTMEKGGIYEAVNFGSYVAYVSLKDDSNYVWSDGTRERKSYPWSIAAVVLAIPTANTTAYVYNGSLQGLVFTGFDENTMEKGGWLTSRDTGSYTTTISLKDDYNYVWSDGTREKKSYPWNIIAVVLEIPMASGRYTYDGTLKELAFTGFDGDTMQKEGVYESVDSGSFVAYVSLLDTRNYIWRDGTTNRKSYSWSIAKVVVGIPVSSGTYVYNGSEQELSFSGFDSTIMWKDGAAGKDAGSYEAVIGLLDTANYIWTDNTFAAKRYSWTIAKADGTITLSSVSKTLNLSVIDSTVTASNYTGPLTASSGDTGVVTAEVSESTIRLHGVGTGSANVTVYVAESDNYKATSATIEVSVEMAAQPMSVGKREVVAVTAGNYALAGGGRDSDGNESDVVEAYSRMLARSVPEALSVARRYLAATALGNYALFLGGSSGSSSYKSTVDAYSSSLVHTTPTALSAARENLAAATVGSYAVAAGGYSGYPSYYRNTVDRYDTSLSRSTATSLSEARYQIAAGSVGDYALFLGGHKDASSSYYSKTVDAYNASLTHSNPTELSSAREMSGTATVGGYVLVPGGSNGLDVYNSSLTRSSAAGLSLSRRYYGATSNGEHAIFAGGSYTASGSTRPTAVADAYDASLTRSIPVELTYARTSLGAAFVGNYALFIGGDSTGSGLSASLAERATRTVDVYNKSLQHAL